MNFLAHLHLSYPHSPEMVGNFIGDFVKGQKYNDYPADISRGILLHRRIDSFTDNHTLQKECRTLFSKDYRLYAGIITDMLFDHYLAKNWDEYCSIKLEAFSAHAYQTLEDYSSILPTRAQRILPKMKAADRLTSYATLEGLSTAIHLMTRYTSLPDHTMNAMLIINQKNSFLKERFDCFYQELMTNVIEVRKIL